MIKTRHFIILMACFLGICFPPEAEPVNRKDLRETVKQGCQSIPEVKFQEILKEYLCKRLGKEKSDIIVSRLKVFGNRPVPAGKISFQPFQKEKRRLEGYVRLIVIISVNGVAKNRVKLSGWVDAFESVVVTNHNIKKGTTIKKDDLYLTRKNISHLPPNILTDMGQAIGLTAKNNIKADSVLKKWMLEKSPAVDKGDLVTIVAESCDIKVTVPGRSLERGSLGELIRVQNSMSKKEIYARVISNSTVVVDF